MRSPACPRCGSTDLELEAASLNGETADETTTQRCRRCGERFSVTAKRD
jgi:DNA-directed RNA polymerase subunit M/transcription elongation factor TFIIS